MEMINESSYIVAIQDRRVWIKNIPTDDVAPYGYKVEEYDELIKRGCIFEKNDCLGYNFDLKGLWVSDCEKVDTDGKDAFEELSNIRIALDKIDIAKRHLKQKDASSQPTIDGEDAETIEKYFEAAIAACKRATRHQNSPAMFFAPSESIDHEQELLNNSVNDFLDHLKEEDISVQIEYLQKTLDDNSAHEGMKSRCLSDVVGIILKETIDEPIDEDTKRSVDEEIKKNLSVLKRGQSANRGPARYFAPEGAIDSMQDEYDKALASLRKTFAMLRIGQLKTLFESFEMVNEYLMEVLQMAIVNQYTNLKNAKKM